MLKEEMNDSILESLFPAVVLICFHMCFLSVVTKTFIFYLSCVYILFLPTCIFCSFYVLLSLTDALFELFSLYFEMMVILLQENA